MCISDFVWILRFHIALPQSVIPQQTQEIQPPVSHPIFMLCVSMIVPLPAKLLKVSCPRKCR